jgi:hypothetical protein
MQNQFSTEYATSELLSLENLQQRNPAVRAAPGAISTRPIWMTCMLRAPTPNSGHPWCLVKQRNYYLWLFSSRDQLAIASKVPLESA